MRRLLLRGRASTPSVPAALTLDVEDLYVREAGGRGFSAGYREFWEFARPDGHALAWLPVPEREALTGAAAYLRSLSGPFDAAAYYSGPLAAFQPPHPSEDPVSYALGVAACGYNRAMAALTAAARQMPGVLVRAAEEHDAVARVFADLQDAIVDIVEQDADLVERRSAWELLVASVGGQSPAVQALGAEVTAGERQVEELYAQVTAGLVGFAAVVVRRIDAALGIAVAERAAESLRDTAPPPVGWAAGF